MKNNKEKLITIIIQFIKFGLVGISNTAVSLIIYYIFLYINEELYLVGNIVGWIISVANAFYWSNKYVFKSVDNTLGSMSKRLLKTYITYGTTFLLSTVLLYLEVNYWNVSKVIAPAINLLITIPLNFLLNKYWAYKGK